MNFNLVDGIIIFLIGISIFAGLKKGFIMSLFSFIGIILAFFISKEYYHLVMKFLVKSTKLEKTINDFVSGKISELITEIGDSVSISDLFKGFDKLPFDMKMMFKDVINNPETSLSISNYGNTANQLTNLIMVFISFAIAILFSFLVIFIVANILDTIVKLPVLNLANKVLGGVLGGLKTVVILYLVFALATPIIMFSDQNNVVTSMILDSESSSIFYENNIVLNYLSYKDIIE
ncbi:MAG: CvpA family protein [Eubacteriales bacterium]